MPCDPQGQVALTRDSDEISTRRLQLMVAEADSEVHSKPD